MAELRFMLWMVCALATCGTVHFYCESCDIGPKTLRWIFSSETVTGLYFIAMQIGSVTPFAMISVAVQMNLRWRPCVLPVLLSLPLALFTHGAAMRMWVP